PTVILALGPRVMPWVLRHPTDRRSCRPMPPDSGARLTSDPDDVHTEGIREVIEELRVHADPPDREVVNRRSPVSDDDRVTLSATLALSRPSGGRGPYYTHGTSSPHDQAPPRPGPRPLAPGPRRLPPLLLEVLPPRLHPASTLRPAGPARVPRGR